MIKAVYPGTFDPPTRGHEDLVRRASRLFDTVLLGIADSRAKRTFFSMQERIDIAKEVLADVKNLSVVGFTGLLSDFVRKQDARVVLRGLRAVSDFEYEFQLAGMNRDLYPDMETIFLGLYFFFYRNFFQVRSDIIYCNPVEVEDLAA